jgi:hypothetical protein
MVAEWEAAMSYVLAAPDMLAAAATDVAGIGSSLSVASAQAAVRTTHELAIGSCAIAGLELSPQQEPVRGQSNWLAHLKIVMEARANTICMLTRSAIRPSVNTAVIQNADR